MIPKPGTSQITKATAVSAVTAGVGAQNEVLADLTWRGVPVPEPHLQGGFLKTGGVWVTGCLSDRRNGGQLVFGRGFGVPSLCLQTSEGYSGVKSSIIVPRGSTAELAPGVGTPRSQV